ncbi:hypothetical protein H6781_01810 [Candidatus Nomurabacteria bacterium]|nr:hypothetical protein [Candidatus Nomurabacteria bacterium]MCB9818478.1 hypothetical protein [Candidatus Nomurabacteria bacterium]
MLVVVLTTQVLSDTNKEKIRKRIHELVETTQQSVANNRYSTAGLNAVNTKPPWLEFKIVYGDVEDKRVCMKIFSHRVNKWDYGLKSQFQKDLLTFLNNLIGDDDHLVYPVVLEEPAHGI